MSQHNIMNVLLYDISQRHAPEEISTNNRLISEIVEGWEHNKYVFPQNKIKFKHNSDTAYRLM